MKNLAIKVLLSLNFIGVIIIALFHCTVFNMADTDLWSRLACGSIYLQKGWVYYKDIFSFMPTMVPWVDHEWLSGILFFLTLKFCGETGILALKLLIIFFLMFLIFIGSSIREKSQKNIIFYALILFVLFPALGSNIRPHDFTYIFFTLWLIILEYSRQKETYKMLWILPATMLLWVNMHAGCISGLALILVYAFSQYIQKKEYKIHLAIFAISTGAMLFNPYFYYYFVYIVDELFDPHLNIEEWRPVNLFDPESYLFFKILIVVVALALIFSKKNKRDPVSLILLISFAIFGFKMARHNVLFAIPAGIFAYEHLVNVYYRILNWIKSKLNYLNIERINTYIKTGLPIVIIIMYIPMLSSLDILNWHLSLKPEHYPLKTVECLKLNNLKGNLLVPFKWGSYVTWKLYPDIKVSMDGRYIEVYSPAIIDENNDFYYARDNWKRILTKRKIDIILLDKKSPVYKKMLKKQGWKILYNDMISVIMVPEAFQSRNVIKSQCLKSVLEVNYLDSVFLKRK